MSVYIVKSDLVKAFAMGSGEGRVLLILELR
jgi:hypothetical protein